MTTVCPTLQILLGCGLTNAASPQADAVAGFAGIPNWDFWRNPLLTNARKKTTNRELVVRNVPY